MQNKFITQTVTCKNCGKLHEIKCYPIINFQSESKEFVESVFSLDLFKVTCDCGAETIVAYDTVIVDMYKKYIIYLYTSGDDKVFYESVEPALIKMFNENEKYKEVYNTLKHTRLVKSINELLEKLLIFDYDLEDKIIECIKLSLFKNEKVQADKINMIYFDKLDGKNILFTLISEDKNIQPKLIGIDIDYYNTIIDKFKNFDLNNDKPFIKIDGNYILDLITKYDKQSQDINTQENKSTEINSQENKISEINSQKK